ncbi:hypothetical protein B7463_g7533, partial [Scytalidium lignicola]
MAVNGNDNVSFRGQNEEDGISNLHVTKAFAEFAANTKFESLPQQAIESLKIFILDYLRNGIRADSYCKSSAPIFKGMEAFCGNSSSGEATIFNKGHGYSPQFAGFMNATYAHSFDFDDTHQAASLHPGVTTFFAALAQAEVSGSDGKQLLTAIAVGYEITCRLGMALGRGAYTRGFHSTSAAGIFGAVATIGNLRGTDAPTMESAFGVAISEASGSMQYLENGAWNNPGLVVHNAFMCLAFAEAGVLSAEKPIEGKFGLLNGYTAKSSPAGLIEGLGQQLTFIDTAVKPYPGCRATHGAIDLAAKIRLSKTLPNNKPAGVKRLTIGVAAEVYALIGEAVENKIHPKNMVDAQFSVYYAFAVASLYGNEKGMGVFDYLTDPEVSNLLDLITVIPDNKINGAAAWLEVEWSDSTKTKDQIHYSRVTGEPSNPVTFEIAKRKFKQLVEPIYVIERVN